MSGILPFGAVFIELFFILTVRKMFVCILAQNMVPRVSFRTSHSISPNQLKSFCFCLLHVFLRTISFRKPVVELISTSIKSKANYAEVIITSVTSFLLGNMGKSILLCVWIFVFGFCYSWYLLF